MIAGRKMVIDDEEVGMMRERERCDDCIGGKSVPLLSFFRAPRNSEITPPFLESAFARFRPCDIFRGVYHFEGTKLQILITSEWK